MLPRIRLISSGLKKKLKKHFFFKQDWSIYGCNLLINFILTTILDTITNELHNEINRYILYIFSALTIISWIYISLKSKPIIKKATFFTILITVVLYAFGLALSIINGGASFFFLEPKKLLYFLVSFSFLLSMILFFFHEKRSYPEKNMGLPGFFIYFCAVVLITISVGSIEWSFPPTINFNIEGMPERSYSQGFTSFFATAGVYIFILAVSGNINFATKLSLYTLSTIIFLISMLGGARGDFIAAIIVIVLALARNTSTSNMSIFLFLSTSIIFYLYSNPEILNSIILFERLSVLADGNYGARDILIKKSLSLLFTEKPACLIIGCGFNYFQHFFTEPFGLYPHNAVLEILITLGFTGGIILLLSIFGITLSYFGWGAKSPLFYILLTELIISMKSGSLIDFHTMPLIIVFAIIGIYELKVSHRGLVKGTSK